MSEEQSPNPPVPVDLHTRDHSSPDAMPTDANRQPRLPFTVVGIGSSAGGLEACVEFLEAMSSNSGMAFVLIQHLSPKRESMVAEILQKHTRMPVLQAADGMPVEPDHVYVIRPGFTLTIRNGALHLGDSLLKPGHSRPIDDFFRSLAEEQQERAVGVIMSGMGSNGSSGAQAIKVVGGLTIAQDPDSAKFPSMPRSLIDTNLADFILRPSEMPGMLIRFSNHAYISGNRATELVAHKEAQSINDILAILRTRVGQDFTGYKKPTVVRRIQRRMSLTQQASMTEYAQMLRQTPSEVQNLSDDLMIHVTGFFRDGEVWQALKEKVIRPLVDERCEQSPIRAWVTACASGEEAYTIAMLLIEAAEEADKQFDIKIFATDMAERALNFARAGIFPGGIESEISADRLARFFDKDDGMYRVKKELRELVVFAPQNVLHDPPFSRLDLVTCRNLLIYLDPDMQQKVLALLHFGLREGGTLVLGNSETIGDNDDLFDAVDKKHRIFRRVGPTRHGMVEFPQPHAMVRPANAEQRELTDMRPATRTSLMQFTQKLLLERYTPASVVVDRMGRIVYFHGDTASFLDQPRGEPTREVLLLARETLRGPIRVALHRAIENNRTETVKDGIMQMDSAVHRIEVTVEPMDARGLGAYFLISFKHYPIKLNPVVLGEEADSGELAAELKTVRDELQSTIEELQTSNEELKASNEEVTSINEELQSSNEELETSKEELQSLNEELTTVNTQLTVKMEELERTSSDLDSLLSSTDIAVIFLDTRFRIRRYTPAVKRLFDLIPGDVGRPLGDLAQRFEDIRLAVDAQQVLDSLVPVEAEVRSESGRWYTRRVLPYRTGDNHIEGVVITFLDITERKNAQEEMTEAKMFAENIVETLHEPVLALRPDLSVIHANAAFYDNFKEQPDRTIGRKIYDLGNGQWNIPALRKVLEEVLPNNSAFTDYEVEHEFQSIGRRIMLLNGRRLDHVQMILLGIRDITDAKQAERALRVSKERLQQMTNLEGIGVLTFDLSSGSLLNANEAFLSMTGYTREQIERHELNWRTLTAPEFIAESEQVLARARTVGRIGPYEKQYLRRDGSRVWLMFAGAILSDGTAIEYCIHVGERRNAETQLRDSEARFRAATDVLPEMLWQVDPQGQPLWHNRQWTEFTGQTVEQAREGGWLEMIHPDDREETRHTFNECMRTGEPWRREHRVRRTSDGEYRWFLVQALPQRDEAGNILSWFGSLTDVHTQRLALSSANEGQDQLRQLLEGAREFAILMLDPESRIRGWNAGAQQVFGYTEQEAIGQPGAIIFTPEDREAGAPQHEIEQAIATGQAADERWHLRKDGRRFWGSGAMSAIKNRDGTVRGFVKILRDMTARKETEEKLQAAKEEAEAANRLKDDFLATLSHELRTPLSTMLLWAKLLRNNEEPGVLHDGIDAIEKSAEVQKQLIDDLLDSQRIATGKLRLEMRDVELAPLVREAVDAILPTAEAKEITVSTDFGDDLGVVRVDPDRLRQIVWNLLTNAVKFTPGGGQIKVGLWRTNNKTRLQVADTGRGIEPSFLPHIFERFRQADPAMTRTHGGLGLGLSIVKQLVEMHGGTIMAASEGVGKGATMTIELPTPRVRRKASPPPPDAAPLQNQSKVLADAKVLLVEDDLPTGEVTQRLIAGGGATVTHVTTAAEALERLRQGGFDLLLSDIGLPEMNGLSLIRELRKYEAEHGSPALPAVALTAFALPADQKAAHDAGFDAFVTKPFEAEMLLNLLARYLRRSRRKQA